MTEINRFSSRRQRLDQAFLSVRLQHAQSYKRIAGYFRSSIFELVGEEIAAIPKVQILCNSELDAADIAISKHVRDTALKERWNEAPSEVEALLHRDRYRRLYDLKSAGFMKTLLLQRICSSFASGRSTAEKMLKRETFEDEEQVRLLQDVLSESTNEELAHLRTIVQELSRPDARDPKLTAVRYFLTEHRTEGKTWLEHGCIVFSQYYDTAFFVASEMAKLLPAEPIGVYAGAGKSGLFKGVNFASVEREDIKSAVKKREIRLVIATDAACEGLNLQTLGTLINVDLPWNPSRLEQRLGRIKRFGQARRVVDMLNLVYHETQDEKVYGVLSRRMKDRYDIFGGLPDTIEDDWIENVEKLDDMMDEYIHLRQKARDVFEMRYQQTVDPDANRWELCSRVLSRRDIVERLSEPW